MHLKKVEGTMAKTCDEGNSSNKSMYDDNSFQKFKKETIAFILAVVLLHAICFVWSLVLKS